MMRLIKSRRRKSAFALLEVIISMVILGVAIAAIMRSFTVSLAAAKKAQIVTTASLLAQQILDEYEVVPPQNDHDEGTFGSLDDASDNAGGSSDEQSGPYKNYYWITDVEEIKIDYPDISFEGDIKDFEDLTKLTITIVYDDGHLKRFTPVHLETYLTNAEKFTYTSRRENKIY